MFGKKTVFGGQTKTLFLMTTVSVLDGEDLFEIHVISYFNLIMLNKLTPRDWQGGNCFEFCISIKCQRKSFQSIYVRCVLIEKFLVYRIFNIYNKLHEKIVKIIIKFNQESS